MIKSIELVDYMGHRFRFIKTRTWDEAMCEECSISEARGD